MAGTLTLSHNIVECSQTIHKTKNLQARQRGRRVFPNSCFLAALFLYPAMQGKGVTQISELVEHDPWVICTRESKSPMSRWPLQAPFARRLLSTWSRSDQWAGLTGAAFSQHVAMGEVLRSAHTTLTRRSRCLAGDDRNPRQASE